MQQIKKFDQKTKALQCMTGYVIEISHPCSAMLRLREAGIGVKRIADGQNFSVVFVYNNCECVRRSVQNFCTQRIVLYAWSFCFNRLSEVYIKTAESVREIIHFGDSEQETER